MNICVSEHAELRKELTCQFAVTSDMW